MFCCVFCTPVPEKEILDFIAHGSITSIQVFTVSYLLADGNEVVYPDALYGRSDMHRQLGIQNFSTCVDSEGVEVPYRRGWDGPGGLRYQSFLYTILGIILTKIYYIIFFPQRVVSTGTSNSCLSKN